MRVLHLVASPTLTGPADPALGLARAQQELLGYQVSVGFDTVRSGNMAEKAQAAGLAVAEGLRLCTKAGLFAALADRRRLRALAAGVDLIHAHSSHDHALAALARGSAKLVRSLHHPRGAERRGLQRVAYRRTDGFVTIAAPHRARLLECYPFLDPQKVALVGGAVDTERFRPGLDGAAFRHGQELPAEAFVVGMIARIKPGRRHEVALAALAEALRHPDPSAKELYLLLVGKGEGLEATRAQVQALGLGARVRFAGFRDADLPQAYAACDATVLLSEGNDAGCRAVLESLAGGVPVIGGRHPAIVDALEGTRGGALVDPDDAPAIAAQMLAWAGDGDAPRAERASAARRRVLERYTERARAEAVERLYQLLLRGGE